MNTNYSRRQLYAFGEPLGEFVTRKEGGRIVCGDGGGGGGSAPSSQTQVSELPEWARGYAKDALGRAAALTDINQNPYQAYGGDRIAGFSPMQRKAQQDAANMQTSGMSRDAGGIAGNVAMSAMNTKYDPYATGQFGAQASNYMSPYMQNVVDIQQREAQRQGDVASTQRNAKAVGAGAFGGSRQAITDAEASRNLATQKGDIQERGLQSAYQQAQQQFNTEQQLREQSRQYGAGLGMQGLQTALQGANTMGNIGQQLFGQGMDINKLQNAYGGQQQELEQRGLTQGYQDFQNQQNYPYKQLGFMSDMIRGLPLGQQSTSQIYETQPGMAQQIGSIGMGAMGLSKFMADGGEVKDYARGGGVDSQENVADIVGSLSPQQMDMSMKAAQARGDREQMQALQDEMGFQASLKRGLAGTVTPEMAQRMAGGGVVAFARGGLQDTLSGLSALGTKEITNTPEERQAGITAALPGIQAAMGESALAPMAKEISDERKALSMKDEIPAEFFIGAARGILKGRGLVAGLANAGIEGSEAGLKARKEAREASRALRASEIQLATADQQRKDGQVAKAESSYEKSKEAAAKALDRTIGVQEKIATIESSEESSKRQAAASTAASMKPTDLDKQTKIRYAAALEAGEPANAATMSKSAQQAASDLGRYPGDDRAAAAGAKVSTTTNIKATDIVDDKLMFDTEYRKLLKKDRPAALAQRDEMIAREAARLSSAPAAASTTPPVRGGAPAAKPSMQVFMDAARKANPNVSDADLAAYYNSKYK